MRQKMPKRSTSKQLETGWQLDSQTRTPKQDSGCVVAYAATQTKWKSRKTAQNQIALRRQTPITNLRATKCVCVCAYPVGPFWANSVAIGQTREVCHDNVPAFFMHAAYIKGRETVCRVCQIQLLVSKKNKESWKCVYFFHACSIRVFVSS